MKKRDEMYSADVLEATGMTPKRLQVWCEKGLVKPAGGEGRGDHRRFSFMQVVGLAVANAVRDSEHGCALPYVGNIITSFDNVTESWLLKRIEQDGPCFVKEHQGKPILRGPQYDHWPNVKKIYDKVKEIADSE